MAICTRVIFTAQHNDNSDIIVSGRDLHGFLGIKTNYSTLFERMKEYGFTENVDFIVITKNVHDVTAFGGIRNITDHHVKIEMAKILI